MESEDVLYFRESSWDGSEPMGPGGDVVSLEDAQFLLPVVFVGVGNLFPRMRFVARASLTLIGVGVLLVERISRITIDMELFLQSIAIYFVVGGKFANDAFNHLQDGPPQDRISDWWMLRYMIDPIYVFRYQLVIWRSPASRRWLLTQAMPLPRILSLPSSEWE